MTSGGCFLTNKLSSRRPGANSTTGDGPSRDPNRRPSRRPNHGASRRANRRPNRDATTLSRFVRKRPAAPGKVRKE
jgi:hypothetical protein